MVTVIPLTEFLWLSSHILLNHGLKHQRNWIDTIHKTNLKSSIIKAMFPCVLGLFTYYDKKCWIKEACPPHSVIIYT